MKKQYLFGLNLILFCLAFAACNGGTYAQFSGVYHLVSAEKISPSAKFAPPEKIEIIHRMAWENNYWRHVLGVAALPGQSGEASGSFKADLFEITKGRTGCGFGPCHFDGVPFKKHKDPSAHSINISESATTPAGHNIDAMCTFFGYDYHVQLVKTQGPDAELLKKIYADHTIVRVSGGASVVGSNDGEIPTRLTDPNEAPIDAAMVAEWDSAIAEKGVEFTFIVSKLANRSYSGCDGVFPYSDNEEDAEMLLTYRMESNDTSADLRKKGTSDADSLRAIGETSIFEQVTGYN